MKNKIKSYLPQISLALIIISLLILSHALVSKILEYKRSPAKLPKKQDSNSFITDTTYADTTFERELRGVWMSRFDYTKNLETHNPDSMKEYIKNTFQKMKRANFNTIFFQVRGNGDAYYKSNFEPWGKLLTGKLGQDPGWDPLAYAIKKAREYGFRIHAWINVFPAWRGKSKPIKTDPVHPYYAHPEWVVHNSNGKKMERNNSYISFSPGNPEVQDYLLKVINNLVSQYDIDGLHLDYIRYPGQGEYSKDSVSIKRFNSQQGNPLNLDWDDWQRKQVTIFVSKVYNLLEQNYSNTILSAATIGDYYGQQWDGYNNVFQDARRWMEINKIDLIVPMLYTPTREDSTGFCDYVQEWNDFKKSDCHIAAGLGDYKLNWGDILNQIGYIRRTNLSGCVFFASSTLSNQNYISLNEGKFKHPAKPLLYSQKGDTNLPTPKNFQIKSNSTKLILHWDKPNRASIKHIILYGSKRSPLNIHNPKNIIAILSPDTKKFEMQRALINKRIYTITFLSRTGRESHPAPLMNLNSTNLP